MYTSGTHAWTHAHAMYSIFASSLYKPLTSFIMHNKARNRIPNEYNAKASNAYDFLYGKSKNSVEAVKQ